MLMQEDFDVNSMQRYTCSLQETLKHTMIDQEVVFKKQVHELHRLYRVQTTLMKDLGCKEFGRHDSWNGGIQSSLLPPTNPIRYEPLLEEARFSSIPMAGSIQPISRDLLERRQGVCFMLQQTPCNLQLPTNHYIGHAGRDFANKGNIWDNLKDTKSLAGNVSDVVDLKLSLSLGVDVSRREGTKRSWFERKTNSYPQVVIDLEDSTERISSGHGEHETSLRGKHELEASAQSQPTNPRSVKKDLSYEIAESSSLVDDGECYQERHSFSKEFEEFHDDIPCNNMSIKKQQTISYEARDMDLNKVQLDDSSWLSNDPMVVYPSTDRSSGGFSEIAGRDKEGSCPTTIGRTEISSSSKENFDMPQQNNTGNLALVNWKGKNKRTEISRSNSKLSGMGESEVNPVGFKSISSLPMDLNEDLGSHGSDTENKKYRSTSEHQGGLLNDLNHTCVVTRQTSCEKSGVEDAVYSDEDKHGNKSAASCKSSCIVDNISSSVKTLQSGVESGISSIHAFDQLSGIDIQSQVAEILSGGPEQKSSGSSELEHECFEKKEETDEFDVLIQRAAESLIRISLDNSACVQDCSTRSGSNEIENEETEQPENSCDSFELITLKLTESNSDDYCVTSAPFEVNDTDKKDFGIKLRRGRRLKDFQRDILPTLSSLASHEIYEDINILEGILRSKEYQKNRAKIAVGESWSPPLRSRRTRLNQTRRRIFS